MYQSRHGIFEIFIQHMITSRTFIILKFVYSFLNFVHSEILVNIYHFLILVTSNQGQPVILGQCLNSESDSQIDQENK